MTSEVAVPSTRGPAWCLAAWLAASAATDMAFAGDVAIKLATGTLFGYVLDDHTALRFAWARGIVSGALAIAIIARPAPMVRIADRVALVQLLILGVAMLLTPYSAMLALGGIGGPLAAVPQVAAASLLMFGMVAGYAARHPTSVARPAGPRRIAACAGAMLTLIATGRAAAAEGEGAGLWIQLGAGGPVRVPIRPAAPPSDAPPAPRGVRCWTAERAALTARDVHVLPLCCGAPVLTEEGRLVGLVSSVAAGSALGSSIFVSDVESLGWPWPDLPPGSNGRSTAASPSGPLEPGSVVELLTSWGDFRWGWRAIVSASGEGSIVVTPDPMAGATIADSPESLAVAPCTPIAHTSMFSRSACIVEGGEPIGRVTAARRGFVRASTDRPPKALTVTVGWRSAAVEERPFRFHVVRAPVTLASTLPAALMHALGTWDADRFDRLRWTLKVGTYSEPGTFLRSDALGPTARGAAAAIASGIVRLASAHEGTTVEVELAAD